MAASVFQAVATYFYYEKVPRTMRAAIVSYLLKQVNGILFSIESLEKHRFSGDFSGDRSLNINPFSTNVPLLYPLKTSENWRFPDVFRG